LAHRFDVNIPYGEGRLARAFEKPLAKLEGWINCLTTPRFNPLYHLGTLAVFLLVVLGITGAYLTAIYRPGVEAAYPSVERISSNWFGLLVRSVHRYASDAFLVVAVLHALKSLASGRFWGSRWLAWVSGWVIAVLAWFTGLLGFWLVWDQRAQWITEVAMEALKGPIAVTFLTTDIASSTYSAFVIALFLHIFIPMGFAGLILVHVARLARARLVSPRWVLILSTAGLAVVAVAWPARSAAPAALERAVEAVQLDLWYLGFLALAERFGGLAVTLAGAVVLVVLLALPWLARGRHPGPAVVTDERCTGCSLCSIECPYHAIEMLPRDESDPSGYKRRARVTPNLCTGCGICVGACATAGIELQHLPTHSVYREGLLARVQRQTAEGRSPAVVFTCRRLASAGGVKPQDDALVCVLPCVGMVDPVWTKELFTAGVSEIAFYSCPTDDCANREGPHWLAARFKRRKALLRPELHWVESAPDDPLPANWRAAPPPTLSDWRERQKAWPGLAAALLGLVLLTLLALPVELTAGRARAGEGRVRIVVEHHGVVKTSLDAAGVKLPEHASVDSAQIMGGERYPVQIQVWVDGRLALAETYAPAGLRKEGMITGMSSLVLPAGTRAVEVRMMDDGANWRTLFAETLEVQPTHIYTLAYDPQKDAFTKP